MIDSAELRRLFSGTFSFLRLTPHEVEAVISGADAVLPRPQRIFLDPEEATPLLGFPVLLNDMTTALRDALEGYLQVEAARQVAVIRKRASNRKLYDAAWHRYQVLLEQATENAIRSSFGRRFASIFWLYHSIAVSRLFKEMPRRVLRIDLESGRLYGDLIRYRVYERFLDRVLSLTYEIVHRVAEEAEEQETAIFPALLSRMRDNVLILTEDHISFDLSELDSYFRGYLKVDGKELRARLQRLEVWLEARLERDSELRGVTEHLLTVGERATARDLLIQRGAVPYLLERHDYDVGRFLTPEQARVWDRLLLKLKEFELLVALRRLVLPVRETQGTLTCQAPLVRGSGMPPRTVTLSASTRPLDFGTPWVIDPVVRRFGIIYDITDFSAIVSYLGRSGTDDQDSSYRSIFRFQRWVNQMARSRRLQLEKYLGDGALYSGRHPSRLLTMAIELQRYYERALDEGFPFNRGLRIALNHGEYRLLPIEGGDFGVARRYEFFGHGIVELTRLVTGKSMREIDEIRTLLIGLGYSPIDVDRFFAPALRQDADVVDKVEEARRFYCYINSSGTLVNEGIVATEKFVRELEREGKVGDLARGRDGQRVYIVFSVETVSEPLLVGIRKLGLGNLKGLDRVPVFEVVDAEPWRDRELERDVTDGLLQALERELARSTQLASTLSYPNRPT